MSKRVSTIHRKILFSLFGNRVRVRDNSSGKCKDKKFSKPFKREKNNKEWFIQSAIISTFFLFFFFCPSGSAASEAPDFKAAAEFFAES